MAGTFSTGVNTKKGEVGAELSIHGEAGMIDVGPYFTAHDIAFIRHRILCGCFILGSSAVDL